MPVGISFENTSLKNSFSLSSLPATETTPENKTVKQRQYNSLTKSRVKATNLRRSWGSSVSDHPEEFWSVLQANYNYIMDNQLIDKCQEFNGDLTINTGTWSLKEFYAQFSELYSWLNSVQETIYGKEENITDKALRAHCVHMVLEKSTSLKLFNDQASQLVQLYPEVQEEVGWRATHLNSKWDSILSILGPSDCDHCDQDTCLDIDHELKCLRKWFKMMESCLQPLDFRAKYTKTEIETKALELNVLHRDIENHGKIVGSVVKLCKKTDTRCNIVNTRRIANGLERRWHLLFLRSLEWQCYLESLSKRQSLRNSTSSSGESDSDCYREPANKYPRLSGKGHHSRSRIDDNSSSSSEDELALVPNKSMIENTNLQTKEQQPDVKKTPMKFGEDTSHFTKSNKKAPNLATYYFKHEDTDSDMDRLEQFPGKPVDGQSTLEETSEEEWTYTHTKTPENDETNPDETITNQVPETETYIPKLKVIPEDTIRRLVLEAEELVSKSNEKRPSKLSKVNRWLSMDKPDDSCDASGEDDEKESQASEDLDFNVSTTTLRGQERSNASCLELNSENLRWSLQRSSLVQLNQATSAPEINNFSISESALHKMNLAHKSFDGLTVTSGSSNFNVTGSNSTSSTVEEISPLLTEKSSPNRRKKSKLRKKSLFGKSEIHLTPSSKQNLLIKSGSFSGYTTKNTIIERNVSSDPPTATGNRTYSGGMCETSTTSGADSDEEANRWMSNFKLGFKSRYQNRSEMRQGVPGQNGTEEQSSLDQVWDNYQENYLSEPYSESHDSDAARKLLNFGEDYSNFIDSQSDWSAFSDMSPTFKRKLATSAAQYAEDSNSDEESLRQLLGSSRGQLEYAEDIYSKVKLGIANGLVTNQLHSLVSTCDHHIALLNNINGSSDEYKMSVADKAISTGLLNQWVALQNRCLQLEDYRKLKKQVTDLKVFIKSVHTSHTDASLSNNLPIEDIQNEIEACNKSIEAIKQQYSKLAQLNVVIHRFTLENQNSSEFRECSLKADILELYELFDSTHTSSAELLSQIESLLPAWKTLELRLDQLQKDLSEDKKTISLLDSVLTNGTFTDQTASSVRDVAKVLSETTSHKGYPLPELFTEGSFSDSGISDEGSEHEIGERQGRLAAIRRLVRQLEVGLAPESKARLRMRQKLDAAEEELKALQQSCRSLIVRTAACSLPVPSDALSKKPEPKQKIVDDDDDPDVDPQGPTWFKRTFKASLAFQLVILTFVCLSCLFEPQCCDYMNNYSWSFSPKLHYDGRPPI